MITSMMSIDSMTITYSNEPIILDLTKVLNDKVVILVSLRWFVWDISSSGFDCIFDN
jgi:hypothetical protein